MKVISTLCSLVLVTVCLGSIAQPTSVNQSSVNESNVNQNSLTQKNNGYQLLNWEQLMPKDELEILLNPPDSFADIADGTSNDSVDFLRRHKSLSAEEKAYADVLASATVVKEYDGKRIKIPGFVVPLVSKSNSGPGANHVVEMLIVPYFGACLHLPPPPPNQVIYAKIEEGFELSSLYNPFWFEGTLKTSLYNNELGDAAYTLQIERAYKYED